MSRADLRGERAGAPRPEPPVFCVIGDAHGHLQLALCVAARWQRELGVEFDIVLLCGDVGTFTSDAQLDSTTRRHAKANPCELEFLHQWSVDPPPAWLEGIFLPVVEGGLGLTCPVAMVHGNHEGFEHIASLGPFPPPDDPVPTRALPTVDAGGHLHYLPSGWRLRTGGGRVVAGVGGIERGQRAAEYHELAYLDEDAVVHILDRGPVDILVTHQGPSGLQGSGGSDTLQLLLEAGVARAWFHGHSVERPEIARSGPDGTTLVVPLADVAFPGKGATPDDPGEDGWAIAWGETPHVRRERPGFWRDYRRRRWKEESDGRLVCPELSGWTGRRG